MFDIHEIFEKSLLVDVVFEARFPILLKIPRDIADFQESIIERFPNTNEIFEKRFFFNSKESSEPNTGKIWEFINIDNVTRCKVFKNKFVLSSNKYKSWSEYNSKLGFKDILDFTLQKFLEVYTIKNFSRLGLRYINKIEIEQDTSSWFKRFFIPLFNIEKYPIENLSENRVRLRVKKENSIEITIQSAFITENEKKYFYLDFDAFSVNVVIDEVNSKIESLHEFILNEFHSLITDECRKKMRGKL